MAVPSLLPLHSVAVFEMEVSMADGSVMEAVDEALQPLASVIMMLYTPGERFPNAAADWKVVPLSMLYCKGFVPPVAVTWILPLAIPLQVTSAGTAD